MQNFVLILMSVAIIYVAIALVLAIFNSPPAKPNAGDDGLSFEEAVNVDYSALPALSHYTARDGVPLDYRHYPSGQKTDRVIVLVHGSAWHGMQFHAMATELAARGVGEVFVPDMRGHGENPQRRGDIDYIGQLEDDIADLIDFAQDKSEADQVVLLGHSSGGGFVVRFAGGNYGKKADAFVLLAPFLKHNAPTTRSDVGGWAHPAIRRIIGLSMLNTMRIKSLNHLPVISFAMSPEVLEGPLGHTVTTQYSYRLNTSFASDDYKSDLKKLAGPLLLVAGTKDSSFHSELFEEVMMPHTNKGTYEILDGYSHIGVVTEPAPIDVVARWINALPSPRGE